MKVELTGSHRSIALPRSANGVGYYLHLLPSLLHSLHFIEASRTLIAARMTDRYNIHSQLEHLQSKYIGTGHADTSKWEWLVNQHRDSYCSYMGHFDLLNYFSVAENESKARVRFNLMEKMLQPCGPPADKPDDA
ncbi:hypothetical protein PFLUV_G00221520 [Perca fluviatilis]|uniref:Splicing factor 3B subunit 5 n=1 Tax=Perca fluviatilis TaxID=8168 RepID=A0A6A5DZH8_PERFL|nr:hypothetical protein PFLUV_G00221520 [Perca fluviatilis]